MPYMPLVMYSDIVEGGARHLWSLSLSTRLRRLFFHIRYNGYGPIFGVFFAVCIILALFRLGTLGSLYWDRVQDSVLPV